MNPRTDRSGYPLDPKWNELELELEDLAAMFRGTAKESDVQAHIIKRYHAIIAELFALGWDLRLPPTSELPTEFMPDEYNRRYPPIDLFSRK
jgi:hypothetical protein